jgi:hypothetical protein
MSDPEKKSAYNKEYRKKNIDRLTAYAKEYDYIHRERKNKEAKERNVVKKEKIAEYCLRHRYGLTVEEYNQMFADQNGGCAICGTHQSELKRKLAVDHDHETGKIRGLLCSHCNAGIGQFKDNVSLMGFAIDYLNKNK